MRARNIKPGIFKNEILGAADPLLTLLFEGLWCLADRDGRLEDRPLRIKAEVFPYRNVDINRELTELARLGFIQRYETFENGESAPKSKLIQVLNFSKHQHPHHTEKKSELPAPVSSPLNNGYTPSDLLIPDSRINTHSSQPSKKKTRKTSLPQDFCISGEVRGWAQGQGHTRLAEHFDYFVGYVKANGKQYADWDQALKNCIRGNWAKLDRLPVSPSGKSVLERTKAALEGM